MLCGAARRRRCSPQLAPRPTPAPPRPRPHPPAADTPLKLRIHSTSVLWRARPELVVFTKCQQGEGGWYEMQGVTPVTRGDLTAVAPHYFSAAR